MGLPLTNSKVEQTPVKRNIALNKDIYTPVDTESVDIKSVAGSVFDGKPNLSVDDTRGFRPLPSMKDWEKQEEITSLIKRYNYIKTGDMFSFGMLKTDSMPKEKIDETINQYRGLLDTTDNTQDGIIGSFQQGKLGDCGFLSGLKVIASTKEGAKIIKDSIKDNRDKTFSVRFLGAPDKVYSVSEQELADGEEYSTGDKDVKILEIAANKWRMETSKKSLYAIEYPEVKKLITGEDYKFYSENESAVVKFTDKNDNNNKKVVVVDKKELLKNIPEGRFFFGSLHQNYDEKGTPISHAFFVKKQKENLLFFNPHNTAKAADVISIDDFSKMEKTEICY